MSHATLIMPHLPYLRRYARALCGEQGLGDTLVAATLEAIVAVPEEFPGSLAPRVALYRTFQAIWVSSVADQDPAAHGHDQPAVAHHLGQITPLSRQALLLVSMEGFSAEEAAVIMDSDPETVTSYMTQGLASLKEQTRSSVLIIEDEPLIAMELQQIVEGLGHSVCALATTRQEAVAAFAAKAPSLVLADIQLADNSSGIEAVQEILGIVPVPVIFITAYPERLLTGERPEPTFLVTKPFRQDTVQAAIGQALFFHADPSAEAA